MQKTAQDWFIRWFANANRLTEHAGRSTLLPKDTALLTELMRQHMGTDHFIHEVPIHTAPERSLHRVAGPTHRYEWNRNDVLRDVIEERNTRDPVLVGAGARPDDVIAAFVAAKMAKERPPFSHPDLTLYDLAVEYRKLKRQVEQDEVCDVITAVLT